MNDLATIRAECAVDIERAKARLAALDVIEYAVGQLVALGFEPRVEMSGVGFVELRFDPDAMIAAHGPDEGAGGERVPDPQPEPVPEPEPEPTKKSSEPRSKPKAKAPAVKVFPWTDEDRAAAVRLFEAGVGVAEVARDLGRNYKQVSNLRVRYRRQLRADAEAVEAAKAGRRRVKAGKGAPASAGTAPPVADASAASAASALSFAEQQIVAHLDGLGNAAPWLPLVDLAMVEGLCRGDHAADLAQELGVSRGDLIARFGALNTRRGDLDHQRRLLQVLKWRAEGAG